MRRWPRRTFRLCWLLYRNWYRFKLFWIFGDGLWESLHCDPAWPDAGRSINAENARHRRIYAGNITRALGGDAALMRKVIPDYPPFAKRMLIDNRWCEMLQRPNVDLLASGVSRITGRGVVDDGGREHLADAIIYATGFHAQRFLWPMEVRGRGGLRLSEVWGDDARAYLGVAAPDFPNLFFFYGPNTNLAHGGSVIFHIECQARYITQCLMRMLEAGRGEIEVRRAAHDAYNERVDAAHARMIWTHPDVKSWYKNERGRVVSVSPWRLVDYWRMTRSPEMGAFRLGK